MQSRSSNPVHKMSIRAEVWKAEAGKSVVPRGGGGEEGEEKGSDITEVEEWGEKEKWYSCRFAWWD